MTFSSHSEYIASNTSEKIVLAHIHGSKRLYNFTSDSSLYSREVDNFVNAVKINSTLLTKVEAIVDLDDNTKYFYDISTKKLYLYEFDSTSDKVIVEFRFFFSNLPINLSTDLSDEGEQVYYAPRIKSQSGISIQVDEKTKGATLIGNSSIKLYNTDGYLDDIFDQHVWDNKNVIIYSFNRNLPASEATVIYRGAINTFSKDATLITFKLKDKLTLLSTFVSTETFDSSTDNVSSSLEGTYKRRIFGKVDGFQAQSIDMIDERLIITGYISGIAGSTTINGLGTNFLNELSPGDSIFFDSETEYTVDSITSNTLLTLSEELEIAYNSVSVEALLQEPYPKYNRTWLVSPKILSEPSTQITQILSTTNNLVADTNAFEVGDTIVIDTIIPQTRTVSRIIKNDKKLILSTALDTLPTTSNYVSRSPVRKVYYNKRFVPATYYTVSNTSSGCTITFSDTFEKDSCAVAKLNSYNYIMENGENIIYFSHKSYNQPTLEDINARDWISFDGADWYEVLAIGDWEDNYNFTTSNINTGTDYITITSHGFKNGTTVKLSTTDTLPSGLSNSDTYYIINSTTNTFQLSTEENGSAVDITDIGTGIHTITANYGNVITTRTTNSSGSDLTGQLSVKRVTNLKNDSVVSFDVYGETIENTATGTLIRTTAQLYKKILTEKGHASLMNTDSFDNDSETYSISIVTPKSYTTSGESIKSLIKRLSTVTHGVLTVDKNLYLKYISFSPDISYDELITITEYDITKWTPSLSDPNLYSTIVSSYNFKDIDYLTEEESSNQHTHNSEFIEDYVEIENINEVKLCVNKLNDAKYISQIESMLNERASLNYTIVSDLRFISLEIGHVVILDLKNRKRLGMVIKKQVKDNQVTLKFSDIGQTLEARAIITSNDAPDYASASESEKLINGYITDDVGLSDDDEDTNLTNLIF